MDDGRTADGTSLHSQYPHPLQKASGPKRIVST